MPLGISDHPDLQPPDELTALTQFLDHHRAIVTELLADLTWEQASARPLADTDLTVAGIVKHLAWAEDRWFQGRLLGVPMPEPWLSTGVDDPDASMRLDDGDNVEGIVNLYGQACERSRAATAACSSLDQAAVVPSYGRGPVNLRWILVHMVDETARHAGHIDILRDAILASAS